MASRTGNHTTSGKLVKRLTDLVCEKARPKDGKPIRIPDGDGLYLQVTPGVRDVSKSGLFRYDGRWQGLGAFPEITLKRAREKAAEKAHPPGRGQGSDRDGAPDLAQRSRRIREDLRPGGRRVPCSASCGLVERPVCRVLEAGARDLHQGDRRCSDPRR
jgi:hypothetical protein